MTSDILKKENGTHKYQIWVWYGLSYRDAGDSLLLISTLVPHEPWNDIFADKDKNEIQCMYHVHDPYKTVLQININPFTKY